MVMFHNICKNFFATVIMAKLQTLKLMITHYKLDGAEWVKLAPTIVKFSSSLKTCLFGVSDCDLNHLF